MQTFPPTTVIRHRKENLKKCSLRGLEKRNDFLFFTFPKDDLPIFENYVMLAMDGPVLSEEDRDRGLLIIDGTWRYAAQMVKAVDHSQKIIRRTLPSHFRTAYPRRQEDCPDPERGLSSLEAIYAAYSILCRDRSGLLDGYYWREQFLSQNSQVLEKLWTMDSNGQ